MWLIGCEAEVPRSAPVSDDRPTELEPGYTSLPPRSRWSPRCGGSEPRTSESPAIEILSSGGVAGGGKGNVQIWEDGTVLFDGPGCRGGARRRGKMSPARVRAEIDKLEEARFFTWQCSEARDCNDSFITSLTVRRGRGDNTVVDPGCDSNLAARAIEHVMRAVGKNPCSH
jgi:hypothetical protein